MLKVLSKQHPPYWFLYNTSLFSLEPKRPSAPSSRLGWIWDMFSPPLSLLEEPLATIYSSRPNSNFGYALLLADLNNDGSDDLIIGAPDYFRDEVSTSKVKGCVFVVFGSGDAGGQFNSFVEISTDFSTDFSTKFPVLQGVPHYFKNSVENSVEKSVEISTKLLN